MHRLPPRLILRDILIVALGSARRWFGLGRGKRVLAIHEITDSGRFREKMAWLKDRYDVLSMVELFSRPFGTRTQVAVTFDDGYACWHDVAGPILEALRIPAVFFVCSGFIGLEGAKAARFCREGLCRTRKLLPMTREQLLDLARHDLFEIGSHTANHVDLGKVRDKRALEVEIGGDRQTLQQWTGREVQWFAYPFGRTINISLEARRYLASAPFQAAFTLIPGFLREHGDRIMVGRDGLDMERSVRLWAAWLNGAYDGLSRMKERASALRRQRSRTWVPST
jgi:peptidoglycan/xylan/chitin deacetylase (PgdA/CDA1 family)